MKKYNPLGNYNPLKEIDKLVAEAKKLKENQCSECGGYLRQWFDRQEPTFLI